MRPSDCGVTVEKASYPSLTKWHTTVHSARLRAHNHAPQHQQRPTRRAAHRLFEQRNHRHLRPDERLAMLLFQARLNPAQFRPGLRQRDAVLQPRDDTQPQPAPTVSWHAISPRRKPQAALVRETKSRRHCTHDREIAPVECAEGEGLSQDGPVAAKAALPQLMAQHGNAIPLKLIFPGQKRAAQQRGDAQYGEEAGLYVGAPHLFHPSLDTQLLNATACVLFFK